MQLYAALCHDPLFDVFFKDPFLKFLEHALPPVTGSGRLPEAALPLSVLHPPDPALTACFRLSPYRKPLSPQGYHTTGYQAEKIDRHLI